MSQAVPSVSIIIPAYSSHPTIGANLETMVRQTYANAEIIVIDSSPDDRTQQILEPRLAGIRYVRSSERLLPHAARNRGAEIARGDLLMFTDPDVYAPPGWVRSMVDAYHRHGGVIVGSVACHGTGWVHMAMHLCKFDKWLPGGPTRSTDISPTVNMLCDRHSFDAVGGFDDTGMLGDTLMSWAFVDSGMSLRFVPTAVIEHHHLGTLIDLVSERYRWGVEFGIIRARRARWSRTRILAQAIGSVIPLRLAKLTIRTAAAATHSGHTVQLARVFPAVAAGHAAWLAGEATSYLRLLAETGRSS